MKFRPLSLLLPLCLALNACQEYEEIELTQGDLKQIAQNMLTERPNPQVPVNAVIDGRFKILGYDIDKLKVGPEDKLQVTWYIESLVDQSQDPKMFVHLQGRKGAAGAWMNLDHHLVGDRLPMRKLKKGEIVRDVQAITIKPDFEPGEAHFYYGIFNGNRRLPINNPEKVLHDNEGRLIGPKITITSESTRPTPTAEALRLTAEDAITLDGKLDEAFWNRAKPTGRFTPPNGSDKEVPETHARFAFDDQNLYVGVEAIDDDVWSEFKEHDSNLWEQEVIELFIDANGDRKDYVELQVSPANVTFDAMFTHHRSDLETARKWDLQGFETAVFVDGTLNDRGDQDKKYTVEMKIPFASLPDMKLPLTPESEIKSNMFRPDKKKKGGQIAGSFSPPIRPDFHILSRFGTLKLASPATPAALPQNAPAADPNAEKPAQENPAAPQKDTKLVAPPAPAKP